MVTPTLEKFRVNYSNDIMAGIASYSSNAAACASSWQRSTPADHSPRPEQVQAADPVPEHATVVKAKGQAGAWKRIPLMVAP